MALHPEALLISNGLIRSYNTTELYCMLCESDTSYATCSKHMESLLHQQNMQWFSLIFNTCGNNVKCEICNTVIAWGKVKVHSKSHIRIPWSMPDDNYDKYKIFFDNQIFQWQNLFHCCICAATFPNCEVALIHITDPKHRSRKEKSPVADDLLGAISATWEFLVCEGLITFSAAELRCKFCSCKAVTISSVQRHVKGLMHVSNKSRFQLKLRNSEIGDAVTTVFTKTPETPGDEIAKNEAIASAKNDLKLKEDSQQCQLTLDYIYKQNDSISYCIICDRNVSNHEINDHTKESNHAIAWKKYGCEAIKQKNSTDYYCGHCDCAICSLENLYRHIKGKKHQKTLKTITEKRTNCAENISAEENSGSISGFCNYIVRINETDMRCTVCDCIITGAALNIEIHLTGKHHKKSLMKYGCERITFIGGNIYHCQCCDVTISHPENVYVHVKEANHMNSLTVADKKYSVETMMFPSNEEKSREIFDIQETKIVSEMKASEKTANVEEIKSATRETTDMWLKKIASTVEDCKKKSDVPAEKLASEEISKFNNNIVSYDHVLKLANMMFFCRICECNIVAPLTVDDHVAGKRHAESLKHFVDEISTIMNDRYYCKCCKWTIYGIDNLYTHLHGNKHKKLTNTSDNAQSLRNAKTSQSIWQYYYNTSSNIANSHSENLGLNIKKTSHLNPTSLAEERHSQMKMSVTNTVEAPRENSDISSMKIANKADVQAAKISSIIEALRETFMDVQVIKSSSKDVAPEEIKSDVHSTKILSKKETSSEASDVREMKKSSKMESSDVWGLACPSISCNYITENSSGFHCEICDLKLPNGIDRHVRGSEHSDSLKKYGCDNISLMGDRYYCASCDCNICGCENVYMHVKGKKHLLWSEYLTGKRQLEAVQKRINELETTEPEAELSSALYAITAEISRLLDQLRSNGAQEMETT